MKLALAQFEIEGGKPAANRRRARVQIESAADRGCDLVVLPEIFNVGYFAFDSYPRKAESLDGETISKLQELAAEREIAICAGSIVEDLSASADRGFETPAEEGYANTSVYIGDTGTRRGVYRKQHLFGYESAEQELLTAGESVTTVEDLGFSIGMTTCYDLRFPTLYRRLVDAGATLVLVPSAWPYPRIEHWQLLPRARAVENLFYVAAVNGIGSFENAELLGRSAVYDPWGMSVAAAGEHDRLVVAEVDPATVTQRREEFPALEDRVDS
jgi:predicted amidohydrolase